MGDNIEFTCVCDVFVELRAPRRVSTSLGYDVLVYAASGGWFEGPRLKEKVLDHGGDWFRLYPDGIGRLDVRIVLETIDGMLINVAYRGVLDNAAEVFRNVLEKKPVPGHSYHFFVTPVFDTSSRSHAWLANAVCVGKGEVTPGGVRYRFYALH